MFFRSIVELYTRKRGDGSAMTLFWLSGGLLGACFLVLLLSIFSPKDTLRGYVVGDTTLYLHVRAPEDVAAIRGGSMAFLANPAIDEVALVYSADKKMSVLAKYSEVSGRTALLTNGFTELSPTLAYYGDAAMFDITAGDSAGSVLAFSHLSGEVRSAGGVYRIFGKETSSGLRLFAAPGDARFVDHVALTSFRSCDVTDAGEVLGESRALFANTENLKNEAGLHMAGAAAIQFVLRDVITYSERFSMYENPFTAASRESLQELFTQPFIMSVTNEKVPVIVFEDVRATDAKETLLGYIRTSLPIVQQKTLPDGTIVQEFTLSPESFAWSELNSDGIVSLVSKENRITLYLWSSSNVLMVSPSLEALTSLVKSNNVDIFSKHSAVLAGHVDTLPLPTELTHMLSILNVSTFYTQQTVDNMIKVCGFPK